MPISKDQLVKKLESSELKPTFLDVVDESGGCGAKFKVLIVSSAFEGKSLLERQRFVNTILEEELKEIHAFSFKKTWTPEEYNKNKDKL